MQLIKQGAIRVVSFLLIDSADHLTGKAAIVPVVTLSKAGAAYGGAAGVVAELSTGSYKITLTAVDTNTQGELWLKATGVGADPCDRYLGWVDPLSLGELAASAITAIWAAGARTLTSFGTLVADIWDAATAGLVAVGSIGKLIVDNLNATIASRAAAATALSTAVWTGGRAANLDNLDAAVSSRSSHTAAAVWAVGARTLTSFGTLVNDIWSAGARTLTSYGTLVADVATAVWGAGARTLTGFGTLVADTAAAVWAAVPRTLTASGDPTAAQIADAIWDEATAGHAGAGSAGKALIDVLAVESGRWEITKATNTLVLYAADGVTPLFSFTLADTGLVSSRTPV